MSENLGESSKNIINEYLKILEKNVDVETIKAMIFVEDIKIAEDLMNDINE